MRVDQFYLDNVYGVVKFIGWDDGFALLDRFIRGEIKPYDKWLPAGQRVKLHPDFLRRRFQAGSLKPIPPPQ